MQLQSKNVQLQYVWISKWKNLENVGVNFSNRFRFEFDLKKKSLIKHRTKNYIEGYFPRNISAVTSLVGENGSGKTTILRLIYSFYCGEFFVTPVTEHLNETNHGDIINEFPGVVIIGSEDSKKSYLFKGNDFEIAGYSKSISEGSIQEFELSNLRYPKIAFHSNFFDVNHILSQEFIADEFTQTINISTDYLLKHDYKSLTNGGGVRENYDPDTKSVKRGDFEQVLTAHKFSEYERQVEFLYFIKERNPIRKMPRYLVLRALPTEMFKKENLNRTAQRIINRLETETKEKKFIIEIMKAAVYATHRLEIVDVEFIKGLSKINTQAQNQLTLVDHLLEQIENRKFEDIPIRSQMEIFVFLLKLIKDIFNGDLKEDDTLHLNLDELDESKEKSLRLFFVYIKSLFDYSNIFVLSFGHSPKEETLLSSGELCRLNLYSRLNYLKNEIQNKIERKKITEKQIILLMDEIELGLHPQWQKSYFKDLMEYLENYFQDFKIQLIFTTHSPFLLSDLPSYANNFFTMDERQMHVSHDPDLNTLGQQIHYLMKDNFFIKGGIIGEYAVHKIADNLDKLMKVESLSKREYENYEIFFENISDEILRGRLQRILRTKKPKEDINI